jgi:hypothetical protein
MGDTISADQFDKLDEGMKKFFSETADGMYALNTVATAFAKEARAALLAKRQEEFDAAKEKAEAAK